MRTAGGVLAISLLACAARPTAVPRQPERPRPVLALSEYAMYRGLNQYRFVLYEDGTVIRHSRGAEGDQFFSVHLDPEERTRLLEQVASSRFQSLEAKYDLFPEASDLPVFEVSTWSAGVERSVRVRGRIEACWMAGAPSAFVRLAYDLCTFSHPREQPWTPSVFELYVESGRDAARCKWPSDWDLGPNLVPPDPPERPSVHLIAGERLLPIQRFLRACYRNTGTRDVLLGSRSVTMRMIVAMPHQTYDVDEPAEANRR